MNNQKWKKETPQYKQVWQLKIYILFKMTQVRLEITCNLFLNAANRVRITTVMNFIAVFKEKRNNC